MLLFNYISHLSFLFKYIYKEDYLFIKKFVFPFKRGVFIAKSINPLFLYFSIPLMFESKNSNFYILKYFK